MSRFRFLADRFSDFHVLVFFAVLLAVAGAAVLALLGATVDAGRGPQVVGAALLGGAAMLALWAWRNRRREVRQRATLDKTVDAEMAKKWGPGFANLLGVYDKPWYLLCGETAVGKTAALRAANLPMALGPDGRPLTDASQGLNGTFMFDWWFFENAVVLDSAGDMMENPDQRWTGFLDRVRDARPIQPVNGMILAVASTDLMGDREVLRRKAALLARQVQVARERLKVRFPLYLLVTKSDLITGFADYFPLGADVKSTFQILGWSNRQDPRVDDRPTRPADVRAGLDGLMGELRARRAATVDRTATSRSDARLRVDHLDEMYAFPGAVDALLDPLQDFVAQVLRDAGGAAAPPFLRGVYFTSALRSGDALDVELSKAFGLTELSASRRAAVNRAYFIRDLFLEKIIPESGMVAPLENVVSGVRRRGRTVIAGTMVAAAVIVVGSVLGYFQTAGRVRPHADLWRDLAKAASDDGVSRLALFDKAGAYRGRDAGPDPKRTLLDFHRTAVELGTSRTASWLLPLSDGLDRNRLDAHRRLFTDLVVVPTLRPPPRADGDDPKRLPERVDYVAALLRDVAPAARAPDLSAITRLTAASLKSRTAAGEEPVAGPRLSAADAAQVDQLVRRSAAEMFGASPVELNDQQQRGLSRAAVRWACTSLDDAATRAQADCEQRAAELKTLHKIVTVEKRVLDAAGSDAARPAVEELAAHEDDERAVKQVRKLAAAASLGEYATRSLGAGADMASIGLILKADANRKDELRQFSDAVRKYDDAIVRAAIGLCAAVGQVPPADTAGPSDAVKHAQDVLARYQRTHLGTDANAPLILKRFAAYKDLYKTMGEWSEDDVAAKPFTEITAKPDYPHPFFRVHQALATVRDAASSKAKEFADIGPTCWPATASTGTPDAERLRDEFAALCKAALAQAGRDREVRTWRTALAKPSSIWLTPAASRAGKLDLKLSANREKLVTTVKLPDDMSPVHAKRWISELKKARAEITMLPAPEQNEVLALLAPAGHALQQYGLAVCLEWDRAATMIETPNVNSWTDVQRVDGFDSVNGALAGVLAEPLNAGKVLEADWAAEFPSVSEKAAALTKRCDPTPPESAQKIAEFLAGLDKDAGKARVDVLSRATLDATMEAMAPAAGAPRPATTVCQVFWNGRPATQQGLLERGVGALCDASRPVALDEMSGVVSRIADKFPLSNGPKEAADDDIAAVRARLDAIRPEASLNLKHPMSVQIRDLGGVVGDDWAGYADWFRQFEKWRRDAKWSLSIKPGNGKNSWSRIEVKRNGRGEATESGLYQMKDVAFTGADIESGFSIVLRKGTEADGAEVKITDGPDLKTPWSLARLAVAHADGLAGLKTAEGGEVAVGITVEKAPFPSWPKNLPVIPK